MVSSISIGSLLNSLSLSLDFTIPLLPNCNSLKNKGTMKAMSFFILEIAYNVWGEIKL